MKKVFVFLLIFVGIGLYSAKAQRLGLGLAYGNQVGAGGVQAMLEFGIGDNVAITPGLLFYFAKAWEGNVDFKWFFAGNRAVSAYAIAGVNTFIQGDPSLGVNLGAGANFKVGRSTRLYTELKYEIESGQQIVFSGGVKFPLW